jgi:2-dehydro-3-deoxy-L-rhamnonate dehydrogenase (NAD+)
VLIGDQLMQSNQINLFQRVAVITGGASGIGLAIAHRFAASGARVVIWDLNLAAAQAAVQGLPLLTPSEQHVAVSVDVTDQVAVEHAMATTIAQTSTVDILVCSAGITGPNKLSWDYSLTEWQQVMNVNINGVFNCNRVAIKQMLTRNYGRIVNIASVAGKEGNPNAAAYSTSKAAVIGMTKSLGKETAKYNIKVNCITPAAVKTPIFDQMTPQHIEFMLSKIPMGRFGEVQEVAAMVAWLASEECSFSTGATFDLSGGRATY